MKGKTVGKRIEHSSGFGFADWDLEAAERLSAAIGIAVKDIIAEGVRLAIKEYDCFAWFPCEYISWHRPDDGMGGKPVADPMIVYVKLPLGPNDDDSPAWSFSLAELVRDAIARVQSRDGKISSKDVPALAGMRDSFRALAAQIDAALEEKNNG